MRNTSRHIGRHHRHMVISYPTSLPQKLYTILFGPLLVVFVLFIAIKLFSNSPFSIVQTFSISDLTQALLSTSGRLLISYIMALVVAIPLALLAVRNRFSESVFLPLFDILESIPILAFFPILIVFFIKIDFLNGAAILILFLSMLWNVVFTVVGGLTVIPNEIKDVAKVFKLPKFAYFRKVIFPSIVPQLVTGSILAVAQGWNIIIVAEVLHTYIPGGTSGDDLYGIGSILVKAASSGQNDLFLVALLLMVLMIAFLNFFVWQKLLHYAERFKFE